MGQPLHVRFAASLRWVTQDRLPVYMVASNAAIEAVDSDATTMCGVALLPVAGVRGARMAGLRKTHIWNHNGW